MFLSYSDFPIVIVLTDLFSRVLVSFLPWPPLFLPFSRHLFALFSPSICALFCRARGTTQSLERGSSGMDLSRKFGKEIPSRNLCEKRSVNLGTASLNQGSHKVNLSLFCLCVATTDSATCFAFVAADVPIVASDVVRAACLQNEIAPPPKKICWHEKRLNFRSQEKGVLAKGVSAECSVMPKETTK